MNFKKWRFLSAVVCFFLLLTLAAAVVGCKKSEEKEGPAATPGGKKWKVGWSVDNTADPWKRNQMECGKAALEKHPEIEVIVTDAQGQAAKQIADIEDLIARQVDLIMVSPRDEKALQGVLAKAYKKGIHVVLVDRMVEGDQWTAAVRGDNVAIGRMTAEFMGQALKGKGEIVQIEGLPGTTTALERKKGFEEVITKKYPGIKIIASQPGNYSKTDSTAVMENFISAYGKRIKGVYAPSANMALGAAIALENAGIDPGSVVICSVDGEMGEIKAILDGTLASTVTYSNCANVAAEIAWRILNKQDYPEVLQMASTLITKENARDYYVEGKFSIDNVMWEEGKWSLEDLISKSKVYTKKEWMELKKKM